MTDTPTGAEVQAAQQAETLLKKHKDGASWFFWIAVLSLVNSAVVLSGSEWSFLIGLGVTQIIDGIALAFGEGSSAAAGITIAKVIAFVLDLMVAGSFILWGVLARKNYRWAYIVGMVLYALDGLIFLLAQDFPSLGFHGFALFCLFNGYKACGELNQLLKLAPAPAATTGSTDSTQPAGSALPDAP